MLECIYRVCQFKPVAVQDLATGLFHHCWRIGLRRNRRRTASPSSRRQLSHPHPTQFPMGRGTKRPRISVLRGPQPSRKPILPARCIRRVPQCRWLLVFDLIFRVSRRLIHHGFYKFQCMKRGSALGVSNFGIFLRIGRAPSLPSP